jgi:hypothetical protein
MASCISGNRVVIPLFSAQEKGNIQVLDVRWNKITKIPSDDEFLKKLSLIDLRDNPLNCANIPRWQNIRSDCLKLEKTVQKTTSTSKWKWLTTQPTLILVSDVTVIGGEHLTPGTISITRTPGTNSITRTRITASTSTSRITPSTWPAFSNMPTINTIPINEEEGGVDFYLHVTLGPAGVLYVLVTAFMLIRRWLRSRRTARFTREM